ncbi:MAG: fumarate hydratase [Gemmatimonadales bacterium]|nr:fumarate hydratase [Gemmatimonadales bacterium]
MDAKILEKNLLELIRRTSSQLPRDVVEVIDKGWRKEKKDSSGKYALEVIRDNIGMAKDKSQPICQDTGAIICYADLPQWCDERLFVKAYEKAVVKATKIGYLRQNSVDSITGENSGTNLGPGNPTFHFHPVKGKSLTVKMMLKGGGSENMACQYSLPDNRIGAGRDLAGVRKCLLDATLNAQGKGCGPGILGVCIGGDRGSGYIAAKETLFRTLDDVNPDKRLAKLEKQILKEANSLGIGPMGFGGQTTLLGVKITHRNRVPASFFVSVAYMCWAFRRNGIVMSEGGKISRWLYES